MPLELLDVLTIDKISFACLSSQSDQHALVSLEVLSISIIELVNAWA